MDSLDMEPMTLRSDELKMAREQALQILKKVPPEEAARIFTKGLKPVGDLGKKEMRSNILGKRRDKARMVCAFCGSAGVAEESLDIVEPLTAPF